MGLSFIFKLTNISNNDFFVFYLDKNFQGFSGGNMIIFLLPSLALIILSGPAFNHSNTGLTTDQAHCVFHAKPAGQGYR